MGRAGDAFLEGAGRSSVSAQEPSDSREECLGGVDRATGIGWRDRDHWVVGCELPQVERVQRLAVPGGVDASAPQEGIGCTVLIHEHQVSSSERRCVKVSAGSGDQREEAGGLHGGGEHQVGVRSHEDADLGPAGDPDHETGQATRGTRLA